MDSFTMLVPVKRLALAKSRLKVGGLRRNLAVAFAKDVISAASAADRVGMVLVVTADVEIGAAARDLGAGVLPDEGQGDLNQALRAALARVPVNMPVAAICADLPALTGPELDRALASVPEQRLGFVADAEGTGTTFLASRQASTFAPRFGPNSRAAHLAIGAREIGIDLAGLRQDVDTREDLDRAVSIGVGPWTRALTSLVSPSTS